MNWKSRLTVSAIIITFGQPKGGFAQEPRPADEAISILREASGLIPMIEGSHRSTAAANIAAEQARAGDLDGALATSRGLASAPNQPQRIGGVACSLAAQGRLPMALEIIAATPDGQEKAISYWQVTQALLAHSKYDDALFVARLISNDPTETSRFLDTLMQIYTAQWKAGDRQGASATLNEALSAVDREPAVYPGRFHPLPAFMVFSHRPVMYEKIVSMLALAGNRDGALPVVARLSEMAAEEQDPEKKKAIWGPLAEAQADVGDFAAALRTAKPLKSDFDSDLILGRIITEQARLGHLAAARAMVGHLPRESVSGALEDIASTRAELGDYVGAREAIDRMKAPGQRASGLADLAFAQVDRNPAAARVTVTLAWKATQKARGKAPSYVYQNALEFVAATRARMGDFAGALEIINGPDLQRKDWPLANIVQIMVEAGKKDEALALSRSQDAPQVRADCLLEVARSLMDQIEAASKKTAGPH